MKLTAVKTFTLSLPGVAEAPHFHFASFRVNKKIFITVPPGGETIHVFLSEPDRETALALYPEFVEKLYWGKKVVGVRIAVGRAKRAAVEDFIYLAWRAKAPKSLVIARAEDNAG